MTNFVRPGSRRPRPQGSSASLSGTSPEWNPGAGGGAHETKRKLTGLKTWKLTLRLVASEVRTRQQQGSQNPAPVFRCSPLSGFT